MARRNLLRRLMLVLVISLALCAAPAWVQASDPYTFHDLGTLGGTYSFAYGINASGQVVGYSATAGDASSMPFFTYPGGPMQDLGTLGGTYSYANGINASGQVVGSSYCQRWPNPCLSLLLSRRPHAGPGHPGGH